MLSDTRTRMMFGPALVLCVALYGQAAVVKILLAKGADVNQRGPNGQSPLVAAVSGVGVQTDLKRRLEVARVLIAAGADVNASDRSGGRTPLVYAASPSTSQSDEMVLLLLAHGANVRAVDVHGTSVLNVAASGGRSTVQLLLDHGADVNLAGTDGSPLTSAASAGNLDVVSLLLDRGAEINPRVSGSRLDWERLPLPSALLVARPPDKPRIAARRDVAAMLIARRADVISRNRTGQTLP